MSILFRPLLPLLCVTLMSACAHVANKQQLPSPTSAAPYPTERLSAELDAQTRQIAQLQQRVAQLENRLDALNQGSNAPPAHPASATSPVATPAPVRSSSESQPNANSPQARYQAALSFYQNGLYSQAIRTLSFAQNGGSGSSIEQKALLLTMQSHQKLGNCESVILIGQRFATRFASNPQAAEALYSVGQCQWNMQQKDIARDTWRKLIQTYPNSAAARRAHIRIQQRH